MKTAICILLVVVALFGIASLIGAWLKLCAERDTELLTDDPNKPPTVAAEQQTTSLWRVTAYCPCAKCCGKWSDGITASGKPAQGKLIAAPPEIPFGTWIDIPGYGYAEVLDRGGVIKGRRLDLLFSTHQAALNWGVQHLEIRL